MEPETRIIELNLQLPPPPKSAGVYRPVVLVGSLAYVSGHGPLRSDGSFIEGCVGGGLTVEQGKEAARQVGLTILSSLRRELGSLNRVRRVVKVLGLVNCTAEFRDHPQVINGCSELFRDVFGAENGVGARSAVGVASLPFNIAVEIEAVLEVA